MKEATDDRFDEIPQEHARFRSDWAIRNALIPLDYLYIYVANFIFLSDFIVAC
jgi:hypothetical protein